MAEQKKLVELKDQKHGQQPDSNPLPTKHSTKQLREPRERSREKINTKLQSELPNPKSPNQQSGSNVSESSQSEGYPEQEEMMNVLGFSSFSSTKKQDHTKSSVQAVFKNSAVARKYRQYMNRPGNFNRKLDAM